MFGGLGVGVDQGLASDRQQQAMGGCGIAEVEHILQVRPAVATSLVEELRSWGLVTVSGDRVVPTPLASAVSLARQAEAVGIELRRRTVVHSVRRLRHLIADALSLETVGSDDLRIVRGGKAVESELLAATILCVRENLSASDTLFGEGPSEIGLPEDQRDSLLRRRTSRELVLLGAGFLTGGMQRRFASVARDDVTYRGSTATPMRMESFDRRIAFLPIDPDDLRKGAYAVRSPALLALLSRIFFDLWAGGEKLELPKEPQPPAGPTGLQLRVLAGLSEGHTDDRIARSLGISRSTVTRAVREMQELLQADSRFQLAVRATREGWLDSADLLTT